jgi:uncharacterized phage protein gp47/JayE
MIDLGHPFSRAYEDLITALETQIREGVEQPDRQQVIFQSNVSTYPLPANTYALLKVSGRLEGNIVTFTLGKDYRFDTANTQLVWLQDPVDGDTPRHPEEGTRFEVEYTYREQSAGLTDFNPGSVLGTLVRAFARELKLLYEQMDQAYRRAFIDEATGAALDSVVALLGVTRNPALKAKGEVTFFRQQAADQTVTISAGTRVADESGRMFVTLDEAVIPLEIDEFKAQTNGIIRVNHQISELVGIWPQDANPETDPALATEATAPDRSFGEDEKTITLAPGVRPVGTLRIRYLPKSVMVEVEAIEPGPDGNVNSGAIAIMPTPPTGVNGVTNEAAISGGQNPESDDSLRERAKHELESSGNATLNAIKYAVLDVDGVEGVEVIDHSVDDSIPLGEVRVRYSGGDFETIRQKVDQTRAAGILAQIESITQVLISGTFYLIPEANAPDSAGSSFRSAVLTAMQALTIGQSLSLRRLNALAYGIPGLADVAAAQLNHDRPDSEDTTVQDPFLAQSTELIRPDLENLQVQFLKAIQVATAGRVGGSSDLELTLELSDRNDATVRFRQFSLNLSVTVMGRLAEDQPPERLSTSTPLLTFAEASTASLSLPSDSRWDDYALLDLTIQAAAYPGLQPARHTLSLS